MIRESSSIVLALALYCTSAHAQTQQPPQDGSPVIDNASAGLQSTQLSAPTVSVEQEKTRADQAEADLKKVQEALQKANQQVSDLQRKIDQSRTERGRDLQEFRNRNDKLEAQVSELTAGVQSCNNSLPTNVSSVAVARRTDDMAVLSISLNRGGFIRSKLFQNIGDGWVPVKHVDSGWLQNHVVKFDTLSPRAKYSVEIYSMDHSGTKEVAKLADRTTHALAFDTEAPISSPRIDVELVEASDSHIRFRARTDSDARIRFFCSRYPEDRTSWDQKIPLGEPLATDFFGAPTGGDLLVASSALDAECQAEAGQRYAVEWEAVSVASGRAVPQPVGGFMKYKTPDPPPLFAFGDPFAVTLSPSRFTVHWVPTVMPDAAEVVLLLNDGGTVRLSSSDAKITESGVEVTMDVPELLRKRKEADPGLSTPLRFAVRMNQQGGKPIERKFEISYVLSDKGGNSLTSQQKNAVSQLVEIAGKQKGKLTWDEIVKLGLPLIMSFI